MAYGISSCVATTIDALPTLQHRGFPQFRSDGTPSIAGLRHPSLDAPPRVGSFAPEFSEEIGGQPTVPGVLCIVKSGVVDRLTSLAGDDGAAAEGGSDRLRGGGYRRQWRTVVATVDAGDMEECIVAVSFVGI